MVYGKYYGTMGKKTTVLWKNYCAIENYGAIFNSFFVIRGIECIQCAMISGNFMRFKQKGNRQLIWSTAYTLHGKNMSSPNSEK